MPEFYTLVIQSRLRAVHKRNALAHGIAHAELGHVGDSQKHENQANKFASLYLIDPDEFREVAQWARDDAGIICAELGITLRVLEAYRRPA